MIELKSLIIGNIEPSVTFILDIDPEIGLGRTKDRGNSENRFENFENIRNKTHDITTEQDYKWDTNVIRKWGDLTLHDTNYTRISNYLKGAPKLRFIPYDWQYNGYKYWEADLCDLPGDFTKINDDTRYGFKKMSSEERDEMSLISYYDEILVSIMLLLQ